MNIPDLLSTKPFAVIGHRGAAGRARENTLKALDVAVKAGAEIAEFDIQTTADGIPIASHDEILVFDSGLRANIRSMKYNELRNETIGGEPIPSIQGVIEHARGRMGLFLEVKRVEDTETVVSLIKRLEAREWTALISFHDSAVEKAVEAGLITGLIYFKPPGLILECAKLECKIVLPRYNLATEKAVALAHKMKLKVVAWTVNDTNTLKNLVERGVDGIATDYPDIITEYRKTLQRTI